MSETGVDRRRSVTMRVLAGLAFAAAAAVGVSGCSPGTEYPSIFPAVHDMPPPRADTPLDPAQVQQATEDLVTERNHLNSEAQAAGQGKTPADAANASAAKPKPPGGRTPVAGTGSAKAPTNGTQTAGADTKP